MTRPVNASRPSAPIVSHRRAAKLPRISLEGAETDHPARDAAMYCSENCHEFESATAAAQCTASDAVGQPATMRHRLRAKYAVWKMVVTSTLVLGWVLQGFPLLWQHHAPAPHFQRNHPSAYAHEAFVDSAVVSLTRTSAVVEWPSRPLVVSPLGVVPKKGSDQWRLIWDGRYVNSHLHIPTFKYETLAQLHQWAELHDYVFTLDLKSGYHHLDMAEDAWTYLGFEWRGTYYCFTQCPFGLATACWAFSKLIKAVLHHFRLQGVRCTGYIDDSLWLHQDPVRLKAIQVAVLKLMADLGFIVNMTKSQLEIFHEAPYLGMLVDLQAGVMRVSPEKRQAVLQLIKRGLLLQHRLHVRELAGIKGKLIAMQWAFGHVAFLYTKSMDRDIAASASWNSHIRLSRDTVDELQFWLVQFDRFNGTKSIFPPARVHHTVHMDAAGPSDVSVGGWGAWMKHNGEHVTARGHWTADEFATIVQHPSSTWMELKAVMYALQSFGRMVPMQNTTVMLITDSYNAFSVLQHGRAKADLSVTVARDIHAHCFANGVTLMAEWVPREDNTVADALSKCADTNDFTIPAAVFDSLNNLWGPFEVDLFAGHANHFVSKFFSRHYSPDCAAINAFAQEWGSSCWAHPPYALVSQVLRHAADCGAGMCLVCPYWPSAAWWRLLCNPVGTFLKHVHGVRVLGRAGDPGLVDNAGKVQPLRWPLLAVLLDYTIDCVEVLQLPRMLQ